MRLFPNIAPREFLRLLSCAVAGALVAGAYGIVHDQITYSISREYFTRFKFAQFAFADFGFPERVFVGVIGFLATWWVGLIAGWFLGRITMKADLRRQVGKGFAWIAGCAVVGALAGVLYHLVFPDSPEEWVEGMGLGNAAEARAFLLVGWIHSGGYAGAVAGFAIAMWRLSRMKCSSGLQSVLPLRRTG